MTAFDATGRILPLHLRDLLARNEEYRAARESLERRLAEARREMERPDERRAVLLWHQGVR